MVRKTGAVQVTGLNEFIRALRKTESRADKEMSKAAQKWLEQTLVPEVRRRAPRRTGRLAGSVRAIRRVGSAILAVGTEVRVPYAGPINFGWPARNIKAQEFIYSTIARQDKQWEDTFVEAIDRWLSEAFPEGRIT